MSVCFSGDAQPVPQLCAIAHAQPVPAASPHLPQPQVQTHTPHPTPDTGSVSGVSTPSSVWSLPKPEQNTSGTHLSITHIMYRSNGWGH